MGTMAKLNLLLIEFSEQHQMEQPTADEKGVYCLIIDDMEIQCFEKLGKCYFCSKLSTLNMQAGSMPIILRDLMNHALVRVKSQTCALGLGEDGDLVLFEKFDVEGMNLRDFSEILENFINALEEYRLFAGAEHTEQHAVPEMIINP